MPTEDVEITLRKFLHQIEAMFDLLDEQRWADIVAGFGEAAPTEPPFIATAMVQSVWNTDLFSAAQALFELHETVERCLGYHLSKTQQPNTNPDWKVRALDRISPANWPG